MMIFNFILQNLKTLSGTGWKTSKIGVSHANYGGDNKYLVVPKEEARIRVQISAAHTRNDLDLAIESFNKIGKKYKVIS